MLRTFSLSIHPCPNIWSQRSPSILLTSVSTTMISSSFISTRSKAPNFLCARLTSIISKIFESPWQAGFQLQPWNNDDFLFFWFQRSGDPSVLNTGYKSRSRGTEDGFTLIIPDFRDQYAASDIWHQLVSIRGRHAGLTGITSGVKQSQ